MGRGVRRRRFLGSVAAAGVAGVAGCQSAVDGLGQSAPDRPTVSAPVASRVGDPFSITVAGLDGYATVEVTATDSSGRAFARRYGATENGAVVRPRMVVHQLETVDPELRPTAFHAPEEGPVEIRVRLRRGTTELDAVSVDRAYIDPAVEREDIERDDRYFGSLYHPPGGAEGPGVLTLHGTGGRVRRRLSELLASRGYPALALNTKRVTDTRATHIPVEYLTGAVEWLRGRPEVMGEKVGVVGHSQGADGALLAGVHSESVGAVVTTDGSPIVANATGPGTGYPAPFLLDGEPYRSVEDVRVFWEAMEREIAEQGSVEDCGSRCFERAFAALGPETQARNVLRLEEIDGPVLLLTSQNAPHTHRWVGPESLAAKFDSYEWRWREKAVAGIVRLRQQDHPYRYARVTYEDALHGFGVAPPYTQFFPSGRWQGWVEERGLSYIQRPAQAVYDARARAWPQLLDYLAAGIGRPPESATV